MDEQQLIDRLDAHVVDVAVGPPPIEQMRTAVRRRRGRAAVLASAAAVAVVAAGVTVWQVADREPQVPVTSDPPAEVPPVGHRWVGVGSAVVAVPETWGTNETECGTPMVDTVVIDQGVVCAAAVPRPEGVDSILVRPYYGDADVDVRDWREGEVDGVAARWSPVTTDGGVASASVYLSSPQAVFVAESSSAGALSVVNDLLAGITLLEEHATVPGFQDLVLVRGPRGGPPAVGIYTERLRDLGLAIEVVGRASPFDEGTILETEPAVGSVVAPGDVVTVTVSE